MERIKTLLASLLFGIALLAALGFGLMAAGVALVLGAVLALALRLAGPRLAAAAAGSVEKDPGGARQAG